MAMGWGPIEYMQIDIDILVLSLSYIYILHTQTSFQVFKETPLLGLSCSHPPNHGKLWKPNVYLTLSLSLSL